MHTRVYSRKKLVGLSLLIVIAALLAYQPGLSGPFVFDDFHNIVDNESLRLDGLSLDKLHAASTSTDSGPLGRPIALLSFALNYLLFGDDVLSFKLTNVLIHALNGILLFFLSLKLFSLYCPDRSPSLTLLAAFLLSLAWVVHPLNLTNVLYVVQRMNSLAAFFTLSGLVLYVSGRLNMLSESHAVKGIVKVLCAIFIFTPLASLSKENGLLLIGYASLIELAFFKLKADRFGLWLKSYYAVVVIGVLFCVSGFFFDWHKYSYASLTENNSFALRAFTLDERLMTEARVLWFYLQQVLIPDISSLTLFHDGFSISRSFLNPITTIFSVAGWGLVVIIGLLCLFRNVLWGYFWVLWFLIGHSMESSIFPLELVHEHRNYVPMIGVMLSVGFFLLKLDKQKGAVLAFICMLSALFFAGSHIRSYSWATWGELVHSEVERAPNSARSHYQLARWYFARVELYGLSDSTNDFKKAEYHFLQSLENNPMDVTGGIAIIRLYDLVDNDIPNVVFQEMVSRLASSVMSPDNTNKFVEYVFCQMEGACSLHPEKTNRMITAVISNPNLTHAQMIFFLKTAAAYTVSLGLLDPYIYYVSRYLKLEKPGEEDIWRAFLTTLRQVADRKNDYQKWTEEYALRFGRPFDAELVLSKGDKDES